MPISSIGIGAKNAPEGREWVVQNNVGIFYVAAQTGKDTRRLGGDLRHVWINGGIPKIIAPAETQPPHTVVQSSEEIGRCLAQTTDITRIWAGQHLQEERGVAYSARHRACLRKLCDRRTTQAASAWHPPLGGFDAIDAAET